MADELTHAEHLRKLTANEQDEITRLYERFLQDMLDEVRRQLRARPKDQYPGISAVAQSVWASFLDRHLDEVDFRDEDSAWALLAEAALRHCNKWNKRWQRHHPRSFSSGAGGQPSEEGDGRPSFDPKDPREPSPEVRVLGNECAALFKLLGEDSRQAAGAAIARCDDGLMERLTPRQREVLGLKMAGQTRQEIARHLGVDESRVDREWKAIKNLARSLGAPSTGP